MKTAWDYTELAQAYVARPDYAADAIDQMLRTTKIKQGGFICDIGAGTAHLTIPLLQRGFHVTAVEPNDAMRELGKKRTAEYSPVSWHEGTGEETGQPANTFDLITFGSSFNVTDRLKALKESHRLLKESGWFACMWNHRDLSNALQKAVEKIIFSHIPNYNYGSRREDQTEVIAQSGLFSSPQIIEGTVFHRISKPAWIEAWASHATLARQAGAKLEKILVDIEKHLKDHVKENELIVPYTTKIWVAQKRK